MSTVRMNITLPEDVGRILAKVNNKSAYIAEAIKEKKRVEDKAKIRKQLAVAYQKAAEEDYDADSMQIQS